MVPAGRLHLGTTAEVGGVVLAQRSNLREFGKRIELSIEASEPEGGLGMFGEPGGALLVSGLEFRPAFLEVVDGLVEAVHLRPDDRCVGGLRG